MSELPRALGALVEPPGEHTERLVELLDLPAAPKGWEYSAVFLEQLYPYASVYLDASGMMGGPARELIAGFWRVLGETPGPEPDHLSALLGAYAALAEAESMEGAGSRRAALTSAREALLWDHLSSWLPPWLHKLDAVAPASYRAWGRLLAEWLAGEESRLPARPDLPAHFAAAPPLERPTDDAEAFIGQLLAPARTGFIITPTDLANLADSAGLVLRAGERRYGLRHLFGQDARATLQGLANLAESPSSWQGPIADHWRGRAAHSADLLTALATEAS